MENIDIKTTYDKLVGENYTEHRNSKFKKMGWVIHKTLINQISQSFSNQKDVKVFDAGCGSGDDVFYLLNNIALNNVSALGCDLSPNMIEKARSKNEVFSCEFLQADFNEIAKRYPNEFDVVLSNMSILHTKLSDIHVIINNLVNAVSTNGLFCIGTKISDTDKELIDPADDTLDADRFTTLLTMKTLKENIINTGMNLIWSMQYHTPNPAYDYGWFICQKS